jgi:tetratricopeptide (TPR) repeat protein
MRRHAAVVLIVAALGGTAPVAQEPHAHPIPHVAAALLQRPLTLTAGFGSAHDAVGTSSANAQRAYDAGLNALHAYEWIDAARAFNQALRADPSLAIAYAGLSVALTELNDPDAARAAIERARQLAANANPHDRWHIDARVAQVGAEVAPGDASTLVAYRAVLDRAIAAEPRDSELLMLRGIAESSDPADRGQGSPISAVPFFDRAIALGGLAAHHYLTHAYENAGRIDEAQIHADAYAKAAPEAPHALHMRGHVLRRRGAIAEAVTMFERAKALAATRAARDGIGPGEAWHAEHNLDLLGSSYWYLGQMTKAEAEIKAAFDLPSGLVVQLYNKRVWPEFLIARGRYQDALEAAARLQQHPSPLVRAVGDVEAGLALMNLGRNGQAAERANSALQNLRAASGAQALVAPALSQLQGEFLLRTGQAERGRTMLKSLAATERARPGPDNWVRALFVLESIARSARVAKDWAFAEWAAREMIAHDANYAGGHYALALAAEAQGNSALAKAEFALAVRAWGAADLSLPERARAAQGASERQKP